MNRCTGHKGWHPINTQECVQDLRASMVSPTMPCPVCGLLRKTATLDHMELRTLQEINQAKYGK